MYGVIYAGVGDLTTAFKTLQVGFMWICIRCEWIWIWFCSIFEFVFDVSDFVFDESTLSSASLSLLLLIALAPNIAHAWTFIKKIKQSGGAKSKYTWFLVTDSDRIYRELAKFNLLQYCQRIEGNFQAKKTVCLMNSIEWWIEKKTKLTIKHFFRSKAFSENLWHLTVTKNKVEIGFCLIWI